MLGFIDMYHKLMRVAKPGGIDTHTKAPRVLINALEVMKIHLFIHYIVLFHSLCSAKDAERRSWQALD